MTDETTTPEAELAALEQAAIDGEPVTPEQLSTARERVTLAGLFRKGQEIRNAAKAKKAAEDARADAKRRVTAMFDDDGSPDALIAEREAAALQALRDLAAAVEARNELIRAAANVYADVSLPVPDFGQANVLDVEGLDPLYYARIGHGAELHYVVEGGRQHALSNASMFIPRILHELSRGGVPIGVKL